MNSSAEYNSDIEVNSLENQIQSFSTSLHCIEKGLEYVHRCQKRVAEHQRGRLSLGEDPKLLLENAILGVQQALYDQRQQLKVLEHTLTRSRDPPTASVPRYTSLCAKHFSVVSEFHDLQNHYAEHQKQLLLHELQVHFEHVTERDVYMPLPTNVGDWGGGEGSVHPGFVHILHQLQQQQAELRVLETGVQDVARMMAEFHGVTTGSTEIGTPTPEGSGDTGSLHTLVEIEASPKPPDFLVARCQILREKKWWFIMYIAAMGFCLLLGGIVCALYFYFNSSESSSN